VADLETSLAGGVLTVLINREDKRNALNAAVLQGILAAVSSPPSPYRAKVSAPSSAADTSRLSSSRPLPIQDGACSWRQRSSTLSTRNARSGRPHGYPRSGR